MRLPTVTMATAAMRTRSFTSIARGRHRERDNKSAKDSSAGPSKQEREADDAREGRSHGIASARRGDRGQPDEQNGEERVGKGLDARE